METADLPLEDLAALLGHSYNSTDNTVTYAASDAAPYVAILFESERADGGVRFVKLLKGKFADGQETIATKGENVEYTTPQLTGTFVCRQSDGAWKMVADAADAASAATTRASWFSAV